MRSIIVIRQGKQARTLLVLTDTIDTLPHLYTHRN